MSKVDIDALRKRLMGVSKNETDNPPNKTVLLNTNTTTSQLNNPPSSVNISMSNGYNISTTENVKNQQIPYQQFSDFQSQLHSISDLSHHNNNGVPSQLPVQSLHSQPIQQKYAQYLQQLSQHGEKSASAESTPLTPMSCVIPPTTIPSSAIPSSAIPSSAIPSSTTPVPSPALQPVHFNSQNPLLPPSSALDPIQKSTDNDGCSIVDSHPTPNVSTPNVVMYSEPHSTAHNTPLHSVHNTPLDTAHNTPLDSIHHTPLHSVHHTPLHNVHHTPSTSVLTGLELIDNPVSDNPVSDNHVSVSDDHVSHPTHPNVSHTNISHTNTSTNSNNLNHNNNVSNTDDDTKSQILTNTLTISKQSDDPLLTDSNDVHAITSTSPVEETIVKPLSRRLTPSTVSHLPTADVSSLVLSLFADSMTQMAADIKKIGRGERVKPHTTSLQRYHEILSTQQAKLLVDLEHTTLQLTSLTSSLHHYLDDNSYIQTQINHANTNSYSGGLLSTLLSNYPYTIDTNLYLLEADHTIASLRRERDTWQRCVGVAERNAEVTARLHRLQLITEKEQEEEKDGVDHKKNYGLNNEVTPQSHPVGDRENKSDVDSDDATIDWKSRAMQAEAALRLREQEHKAVLESLVNSMVSLTTQESDKDN